MSEWILRDTRMSERILRYSDHRTDTQRYSDEQTDNGYSEILEWVNRCSEILGWAKGYPNFSKGNKEEQMRKKAGGTKSRSIYTENSHYSKPCSSHISDKTIGKWAFSKQQQFHSPFQPVSAVSVSVSTIKKFQYLLQPVQSHGREPIKSKLNAISFSMCRSIICIDFGGSSGARAPNNWEMPMHLLVFTTFSPKNLGFPQYFWQVYASPHKLNEFSHKTIEIRSYRFRERRILFQELHDTVRQL